MSGAGMFELVSTLTHSQSASIEHSDSAIQRMAGANHRNDDTAYDGEAEETVDTSVTYDRDAQR